MITAVIPSYRNPEYLDLCLKSAFDNMVLSDTEVLVVLDGFADESKDVIAKYPNLSVLPLEENRGVSVAHNFGVFQAKGDWVALINDDNVFPRDWDKKLKSAQRTNTVIAPNQIEPLPSIFKNFVIKNFGVGPADFQYEAYLDYEASIKFQLASPDGQTWPLFIEKKWYMALGGIDEEFPRGAAADWDFFTRCDIAGLRFRRDYNAHFYHFSGAANKKTPEKAAAFAQLEQEAFRYYAWKWGFVPVLDENYSKLPKNTTVRGIKY
jgi:glycosyltransferase involved in cell wall biosynthesis